MTKFYKATAANGKFAISNKRGGWHLPTGSKAGKWMPAIKGDLIPCRKGYHLCRPQDLIHWLNVEIYEAEYDGDMIEADDKIVVRRARLVRRVKTWNDRTARLFAADCAARVLPIWERKYPDDKRPRRAIKAARDFAHGKINDAILAEEEAAAEVAMLAAVAAAERAAAAAAWWAAADAAAAAVAVAAAERAAAAAAWATKAAAERASAAAQKQAERQWQTKRLFEYLNGARK